METPSPPVKLEPTGTGGRSGRALDVRLREIFPFEQKRRAGKLGLSVDETVPKVEPRGMSSSLAVANKGFERDMGGFRLDGVNDDARQAQELHDVRLGVLDRTPEDADKPQCCFVNRHRRVVISDARPSASIRASGLRLSGDDGNNRGRIEQSRVAAEVVVKVLVSLQARARNRRDTLLERLQPLRERLLALDARKLVFEGAEDRVRLGATANSGQLRRQFDDTAVSNLQHGGFGLHLY
jgi:hypothetical protein